MQPKECGAGGRQRVKPKPQPWSAGTRVSPRAPRALPRKALFLNAPLSVPLPVFRISPQNLWFIPHKYC